MFTARKKGLNGRVNDSSAKELMTGNTIFQSMHIIVNIDLIIYFSIGYTKYFNVLSSHCMSYYATRYVTC